MGDRPYVLLKCSMSLDGFLDDRSDGRLLLSSPEDFERVDAERARVDAILVGATTLRKDNPRLMVRSAELRRLRVERGLPETPIKVVLTAKGELDPGLPFFTTGACEKIVYTIDAALDVANSGLDRVATVVSCGATLGLETMLEDLKRRGVERLMVEGGGTVHTQFLTQNLVDELQVCVAPFFVGDSGAPRFVGDGTFPFGPARRMELAEVGRYGDCTYMRYLLAAVPGETLDEKTGF
jgi:5-amino-6-(5-phosphoribosylamino)uracil reductase